MSKAERNKEKVCLVTVTYGDRRKYVLRALESALVEGVDRAIVIDNGSVVPIRSELHECFGEWASVERFERNQGSAVAFKKGIEMAVESGLELVLLLDDDNQLSPGSLEKLVKKRLSLANSHGNDNCAVVGKRFGHLPPLAGEVKHCFLGFHFRDIPKKIARRLAYLSQPHVPQAGGEPLHIAYAPYSSLLFHRTLPERHGLPNEEFILYADDSDFTYRITASGGFLGLVKDAEIIDQDASWNASGAKSSFLKELVDSSAETRVFYTVRNLCYFEEASSRSKTLLRQLNGVLVVLFLTVYCFLRKKPRRWLLLKQALLDARHKRLGLSSDPACALP